MRGLIGGFYHLICHSFLCYALMGCPTCRYQEGFQPGAVTNATGLPNTCDREEPGNCGCLHSEENAVINCDSPRSIEKVVFVTHLPCTACAKRLVNLGNVKKVWYRKDYRLVEAVKILRGAGIEVEQVAASEADPTPKASTI